MVESNPPVITAENPTGRTCSILSICFGAIAFLLFPIVFGPAGLVLGIIGVVNSKNKSSGTIGIIVSVIGTIVGMIIGAAVSMSSE